MLALQDLGEGVFVQGRAHLEEGRDEDGVVRSAADDRLPPPLPAGEAMRAGHHPKPNMLARQSGAAATSNELRWALPSALTDCDAHCGTAGAASPLNPSRAVRSDLMQAPTMQRNAMPCALADSRVLPGGESGAHVRDGGSLVEDPDEKWVPDASQRHPAHVEQHLQHLHTARAHTHTALASWRCAHLGGP